MDSGSGLGRIASWWVAGACLVLRLGAAGPLAPAEALKTFELSDPGLVVELVASEPDVLSPVAMAWDHRGRLFVAEMRDYPALAGGGAIRLLEDRDGDGRMETSRVFADGIPFPGSVLPWRDGVFVASAPEVLFLRDTDGDGRADERHRVLTGFGAGNQQLRVNGLTWGLDGWIHVANGRSDGTVRMVVKWDGGKWVPAEGAAVPLRGRDLRFHPETGRVEGEAGRSQFGLGRDDWGNRFLSWNTIPARHEVFPDRFLERSSGTAGRSVLVDLMPPGDPGAVFPRTAAPRVFNNESSGHFNALSGLHVFRGQALGEAHRGRVLVGESLRNLVHARALVADGVTFRAERAGSPGREFLASADPWFHPVGFGTGPDGALYIADFYREFVEHPDWVAKEMRGRVDWARGREHGRIWRVRARGAGALRAAVFPDGPTGAWVGRLDTVNGWERDTAHRLLLEGGERGGRDVEAGLKALVREGRTPEGRGLALRILGQLGLLDLATMDVASRDRHPRVREQAAWGIGEVLGRAPVRDGEWSEGVGRLARDADARVRLAAVLVAGGLRDGAVREALLEGAVEGEGDAWIRLAAASSSSRPRPEWLPVVPAPAVVRAAPTGVAGNVAADRERVLEEYRAALERKGNATRGGGLVRERCLACHFLNGEGQRIGPDLAGVAVKEPETLLADVLVPNRRVTPDFVVHEVTMKDGKVWTGLVASETATRLTLRFPGAPDLTLARSEVLGLRSTGRSLMPDGLETGWGVEEMADVLAFLRGGGSGGAK